MDADLAEHQKKLRDQQVMVTAAQTNLTSQGDDITNQFLRFAAMEGELGRAQTNINEQQGKVPINTEAYGRNRISS